jgi:2-keto-4-pentenoate hydratase/2-oxohepta-3-ene-1,7-dioic acid hydratase in catechol pathway
MKYCRMELDGRPEWGLVEERAGTLWITARLQSPWKTDSAEALGEPLLLSQAQLLAPVTPSKILCVGRNYRDHAKELGNEVPAEPLLFFKPPSSLLGHGGVVRMPRVSERIDYEGELAIVIGRRLRNFPADQDISACIHGLTVANDVTARDLQKKDGQWTRAKGFDTFCPVGPIVDTSVTAEAITAGLLVETRLNGELRQHGSTADFIFSLPQLLAYITAAITLEPGDLLLTGTPAGVGPVCTGDTVEVTVAGVGALRNTFAAEED